MFALEYIYMKTKVDTDKTTRIAPSHKDKPSGFSSSDIKSVMAEDMCRGISEGGRWNKLPSLEKIEGRAPKINDNSR
jgi:hypothetical protein